MSVVVIGEKETGKSTIIDSLMLTWTDWNVEDDKGSKLDLSVDQDEIYHNILVKPRNPESKYGPMKIRFIEVDLANELWSTLEASSYVLTYTANNRCSLESLIPILNWLRQPSHSPDTPIMVLATGSASQSKELDGEAKSVASTYNAQWLRVSCNELSANSTKQRDPPNAPERLLTELISALSAVMEDNASSHGSSPNVNNSTPSSSLNNSFDEKRKLRRKKSKSCDNFLTITPLPVR